MRRAALLLLSLATVPAYADWLVTRDNRKIETLGPWRIDEKGVRYAVLDGRGSAEFLILPVEQVDVERSLAETARQAAAASSRTAAPVSSGAFLEGWEDWVLEGLRRPRSAELRLALGGERWDNLMQAPMGDPREEASAVRSEARLTLRLLRTTPIKSYAEIGRVHYDARPTASGFGAGLGFDGERHAVQVMARVDRDRPAADVGDVTDAENDVLSARLRYALRTRRLEGWVTGERYEQRFGAMAGRNSRQQGVQAGILYYLAGRRLAPEVSFGWSRLGAVVGSEDYGQRRLAVGLRYSPWRMASANARFEHTRRTYDTMDPRARNFERDDTRTRWSLGGQVRVTRHAAWNLLYERVEGDSMRAGRAFSAWNVSTGLTLRVGSTATPPARPMRGPRRSPR